MTRQDSLIFLSLSEVRKLLNSSLENGTEIESWTIEELKSIVQEFKEKEDSLEDKEESKGKSEDSDSFSIGSSEG